MIITVDGGLEPHTFNISEEAAEVTIGHQGETYKILPDERGPGLVIYATSRIAVTLGVHPVAPNVLRIQAS